MSMIKIKFKEIEIEFEGSEEFIKEELPDLFDNFSKLLLNDKLSNYTHSQNTNEESNHHATEVNEDSSRTYSKIVGTSNHIANKIGAKNGTGLVTAVIAKLHFVDNMKTISRKDITTEMRSATSYYKETYRKNLTNTLKTLMKNGKINEIRANEYALSANAIGELEPKLV